MEKFRILYDTPRKSWHSSCVGDHLMVLTNEIWIVMAFMKYRYYTIWRTNFPNMDAYVSLFKTKREHQYWYLLKKKSQLYLRAHFIITASQEVEAEAWRGRNFICNCSTYLICHDELGCSHLVWMSLGAKAKENKNKLYSKVHICICTLNFFSFFSTVIVYVVY